MNKSMNLAGKRFGRWVVGTLCETRKTNVYWLCSCDCGESRFVRSSELLSGRSGGCHRCQSKRVRKAVRAKPITHHVEYRYYSPTQKRFGAWEYFGRVSPEKTQSLLQKNNKKIEYRIREKPKPLEAPGDTG